MPVRAEETSDPYLMTAYDRKSKYLMADRANIVTAEVDISGDGNWVTYQKFSLKPGETTAHAFPTAFSAYWIRFRSAEEASVSAQLDYQ